MLRQLTANCRSTSAHSFATVRHQHHAWTRSLATRVLYVYSITTIPTPGGAYNTPLPQEKNKRESPLLKYREFCRLTYGHLHAKVSQYYRKEAMGPGSF